MFLTLTLRIRQRLTREIFDQRSKDVYGSNTPFLDREMRYNRVRSAIGHLYFHQHYTGSQTQWAEGIMKIRDAHDELLRHPDIDTLFSHEQQARIKSALKNLVDAGRQELNEVFDEEDIQRFVELSMVGRARFETGDYGGRYDPNEFIDKRFVTLASIITGNFPAWRATLNHEYLPA